MLTWLMDCFRKPNAERIARETLHVARIELLQARYYEEHYGNSALMLEQRIKRLDEYLSESERLSPVRAIRRKDA